MVIDWSNIANFKSATLIGSRLAVYYYQEEGSSCEKIKGNLFCEGKFMQKCKPFTL